MRRIKTKADAERAQRRNNIIMGIVMTGLLVFASLGYSLMSAEGSDDEGVVSELGFDFVRDGGFWKIVIFDDVFGFQYLPSEVEGVEVDLSIELGEYSGEPLYFVNSNEGAGEILNNIGRYVLRYQEACINSSDVCVGDLPVKDCDSNLIIFEIGNETRVWGNEGCVYIVGDSIRAADAFLYEVLGIR